MARSLRVPCDAPRWGAAPLVITLLAALAPSEAGAQELRRLQLEDYLDMESVSSPQISPDGSRILYTRGWGTG